MMNLLSTLVRALLQLVMCKRPTDGKTKTLIGYGVFNYRTSFVAAQYF